MCELLGINSHKRINVNRYLTQFFSHSEKHCHGWGLALFYGDAVSLEKEPICANQSLYLHERIKHPIFIDNMIAHIRLASVGRMYYENSHPFVKHDNRGRSWTLAHNGTIFDFPHLDDFKDIQEGQTDSERILYYFIDEINKHQDQLGRALEAEERFELLETLIADLSIHNKLNLLIWDGEYMYAHTNYANTLHYNQITPDTVIFSTQPLEGNGWKHVEFLHLQVWKEGQLVYQGQKTSQEYFDPEKDYEYKNFDYAIL